ncbi:hypothetical protein, partial [Salmonella enterica]
FNKSKGVLITGLKLKAFRNPQPSWGFSIDKKNLRIRAGWCKRQVRRAYRIISPINTSGILIVGFARLHRQSENAKE